jgi:hypothetical protein
MSVYSIAKDIREIAGDRLTKLGIKVVEYTPDDDGEDYEVCFRRYDRRSLVVSLRLRTHGDHLGDWSDVQGLVEIHHDVPIPGPELRYRGYAGIGSFPINGNLAERVADIVDKIEETGLAVVPVDLLDEGVVTNLKVFEALKSFKELEEIVTGVPRLAIDNDDPEGIIKWNNVARLYCDDVEFIRVQVLTNQTIITNAINGHEDTAHHIDDLKQKIKEAAFSSYTKEPGL